MAKTEYTVAPGNSFTAHGIVYVGGDAIPAAVFHEKAELARLVSAGRIIEKEQSMFKFLERKAEPKQAEVPVKKTSRKKEV